MPSMQCSWILTEDLFWYKFFQNESNYLIVSPKEKKKSGFPAAFELCFFTWKGKKKTTQPWMFSYSVTRHFRSKTLKGSKKISKIKTPRSEKFFPRVVKTNRRRKQSTDQILSPLCFLAKDLKVSPRNKKISPINQCQCCQGRHRIKHAHPGWRGALLSTFVVPWKRRGLLD